eukprot:390934_1
MIILPLSRSISIEIIVDCIIDFSSIQNSTILAGRPFHIIGNYKIIGCPNTINTNQTTIFQFTSSDLTLQVEVEFKGIECNRTRNTELTADWSDCKKGINYILPHNYKKITNYILDINNKQIGSQSILSINNGLNITIA